MKIRLRGRHWAPANRDEICWENPTAQFILADRFVPDSPASYSVRAPDRVVLRSGSVGFGGEVVMKGGAHGPELVKPGLLNAAKDAKGRGLVVRVPLTDPEPMEWVALAAAWTFVLVSAYLIFAGGLL